MTAPFYRNRAVAIFALLGAISGAASAITWPLLILPAVFYGMPPDHTISLSPGLMFAVALALGVSLTATRRVTPIASVMAGSLFGWWIVIEFTAHPLFFTTHPILGIGPWLGAGLVGALIVGTTGALAGLYRASAFNLAGIGLVGTVVGLLVFWPHQHNYWILFVAWQAAVGAAFGNAIARSRPTAIA